MTGNSQQISSAEEEEIRRAFAWGVDDASSREDSEPRVVRLSRPRPRSRSVAVLAAAAVAAVVVTASIALNSQSVRQLPPAGGPGTTPGSSSPRAVMTSNTTAPPSSGTALQYPVTIKLPFKAKEQTGVINASLPGPVQLHGDAVNGCVWAELGDGELGQVVWTGPTVARFTGRHAFVILLGSTGKRRGDSDTKFVVGTISRWWKPGQLGPVNPSCPGSEQQVWLG